MAAGALSRDKVAFGRAVLLATDSVGLSPEGAFWIWDAEEARWDYFLVTSLFDELGGRELYLRLFKVLKEKLSEVETRDFTFYIAGPDEGLIKKVRDQVATSDHVSEPKSVEFDLEGKRTKVVAYRMAGGHGEKSVRRAKRVFRRLSDEFVAA
ncbi:MAG: hypothetical protein ACFCUT_06765 [Kiloniellaceae bacterium]